ncbi:MAG: NAD-dependent epimerase/dehydratase family protein [Deltaproteobacteria bacterium]|nr:NAD-dependent epimerase/dehydratase family protein [Deltaproteobacteria bacterium]
MRVIITGGAGFIGSHLAEHLLRKNHEVVCLDNFNDFYSPNLKRRNIEKALESSSYTLVAGDILDRDLLGKVFSQQFDAVIHLAAYAGVRPSIKRPDIYQRVNVEGTLNLLEQCRIHKVSKFVFASSSSVYGGRTSVPFKEDDDVMHPVSPYAATKVAGEAICHAFHKTSGLSVHALRFFTVYGPRQRPEMAIHLFANHILQGNPLPVFGDGSSARDYTYIDDIVDGIVASLERCNGFEVINVGGSNTTSLSALIDLLGETLNVTPIINREPDQIGDVPITFADVSRAKKILGYVPKVGIEEGINRFCAWLTNQRNSDVDWDTPDTESAQSR